MILLFLSLWSGFAWHSIPESAIDEDLYEVILNSEEGSSMIMRYGGVENLVRGFIHLDYGIFEGGNMVLLHKRFKIKRTPENLILVKRAIEMKKHNRYAALYKGEKFKEEWKKLKRETESKLRISSLEDLSRERLREFFPERVPPTKKEIERLKMEGLGEEEMRVSEREREEREIYPEKIYFSFLSVEENGRERLMPVILQLSPIDELIGKFTRTEEEGGER